MKRIAVWIGVALAAFAVVTLVALEAREVVVVRTFGSTGPRETRTWIAEADGSVWIEAGNAERPFYRDIVAGSDVEIDRGGTTTRYAASVEPNPAGHVRVRQLLRAKHGWADLWIGLLVDTSHSHAIRLTEPRAPRMQ